MLSLSPAKLLVVLVIALIVLGPDKLPDLARQAGAFWHDFRKLRGRLESEVRGAFPDLPSSHQLSQAVRSPLSFLDDLADRHAASQDGETPASDRGPDDRSAAADGGGGPAATNGSDASHGNGVRQGAGTPMGERPAWHRGTDPIEIDGADDPNMN